MKVLPNTLSTSIMSHISVSGTRLETVLCLVGLFVRYGSVCLWRLAAHVEGEAQVGSVRRRFYRFFQFACLDQGQVARLVLSVLKVKDTPVVLVIDRTNWQFGKTDINILMVCVVWHGMGIPLMWSLLPHKGNSCTTARTNLLATLMEAVPGLKIARLIGDREFVGENWMRWCLTNRIPFLLRLRDNQMVMQDGYAPRSIAGLARSLEAGQTLILKRDCQLGGSETGVKVRLAVMRLSSGELLALACTQKPKQALALYRERWRIETLFGNLKTKGFHLEGTHLTCPKKIATLVALLAIASAWIATTARSTLARKPIPTNVKGKTQSIFARGFDTIRKQWAHTIHNNLLKNNPVPVRV